MKKIVCLLLVLVCSFAMFSCGKTGKSDVDTIKKIVNESVATKIVTQVDFVPVDDEALSGVYTTVVDRDSKKSQFTFVYSRYAVFGENHPTRIKTVEGSVWYDANGTVSRDEGDTWEANNATGYLPYSLDISESRFKTVTISEDGTDMTAEIDPSEAKRVFGVDISAEGDITLVVETNGTYLYRVTVTYTTKNENGVSALVTVVTSYDYGDVDLKFGETTETEETEGETEGETEDGFDDGTDAAE